jgi:NADP-dependent 3-hydroxy acid dehydrogenase YdfG
MTLTSIVRQLLEILGVNLWGVVHGIEVFLPWMLEQDAESHIVNTSSMNGSEDSR